MQFAKLREVGGGWGGYSLSLNSLHEGLLGGILAQLLVRVVAVDIVPDPDELLVKVRARQQHHCDSNQVVGGDLGHIGRVHLPLRGARRRQQTKMRKEEERRK